MHHLKLRVIYLMFIICSVVVSSQNVKAQTVVVQNNNGTSTTSTVNPNILYINGIPSTQDIGGVETMAPSAGVATFTNHQPFTVTVNYKMFFRHVRAGEIADIRVGSLTIKSGETKRIEFSKDLEALRIYTITRKL